MTILTTTRNTGRPHRQGSKKDRIGKSLKRAAQMTPSQKKAFLKRVSAILDEAEKYSGGRGCPGMGVSESEATTMYQVVNEPPSQRHARLINADTMAQTISRLNGPVAVSDLQETLALLRYKGTKHMIDLRPKCPWGEHLSAKECAQYRCFDVCVACGCRVTADPKSRCRSCESEELFRRHLAKSSKKIEARQREALERQRARKGGKWGQGVRLGEGKLGVIESLNLPPDKKWKADEGKAGAGEGKRDGTQEGGKPQADEPWYPNFELHEEIFGLTEEEQQQKKQQQEEKMKAEQQKRAQQMREEMERIQNEEESKRQEKFEDPDTVNEQIVRDFKVAYFLRNYCYKLLGKGF